MLPISFNKLRLSNIIKQQDEEINDFQQYCMEISGLPVEADEDTNALTIKVGSLMGVQIDEKDISISHPLPHKAAQNGTYSSRLRPREGTAATVVSANRFPRIIVNFVRRTVKEQFYQGRKHKSTNDTGLSRLSVNNIFISESLSPRNKSLFKDCLKFKRDYSYRYIWTQSGRIYLRKYKDLPAHIISSMEDLEALSR